MIMASRAFKPASLLASAPKSPRSSRPAFTRTESTQSTSSVRSEDSFVATLKGLTTMEGDTCTETQKQVGRDDADTNATPVKGTHNPRLPHEDTPSRKRSQPIAIEAPESWKKRTYTPLSARGDLVGGYFPLHGEVTQHYRAHPFTGTNRHQGHHRTNPDVDSPTETMSNASSAFSSPYSEDTGMSSSYVPPLPEPLFMQMPLGKYHPSNYQSPANTSASTPISTPSASSSAVPLPPTALALPHPSNKRQRPSHQRRSSDMKRKIQQYQQNMIAQARAAASTSSSSSAMKLNIPQPNSPKLQPAGSPGPITPFELEDSASAGYMLGGTRLGNSLIGGGLGRERERDQLMRKLLEDEQTRSEMNVSPVPSV